jgi:hypothetical protein
MSKNLHTSLAAATHLVKGSRFIAPLALKVEYSLITLVGTLTPKLTMMEWDFFEDNNN